MQYVNLGQSGLRVSRLGLGTWVGFERADESSAELFRSALSNGVNFIDTADVYAGGRSELTLGELLKGYDRSELVLASKVFFPTGSSPNARGLSRKHLIESIGESLTRLGVDYLDVLYCHRHDPTVPLREVVQTMGDLIRWGKTLYWGVSMWPLAQVQKAVQVSLQSGIAPPICQQVPYSLVERRIENEGIDELVRLGVGVVAFSPLARGVLSGKYSQAASDWQPSSGRPLGAQVMDRHLDPDVLRRVEQLSAVSRKVELSTSQLSIAWLANQPQVDSIVFGATHHDHVRENVLAADVELQPSVKDQLDILFPPGHGSRSPESVDPASLHAPR